METLEWLVDCIDARDPGQDLQSVYRRVSEITTTHTVTSAAMILEGPTLCHMDVREPFLLI